MSRENEAEQVASSILEDIVTSIASGKRKSKESIDIYVGSIFWEGQWTFHVTKEMKINRIKILSLFELYGEDFDSQINIHMLTFPKEKRSLRDTKTIKDEHINDKDELELIKLPETEEFVVQFVHKISNGTIEHATRHLPPPIMRPKICNVVLDIQPPEFTSDIRKIMITLIEHSLLIMSTKQNAKYVYDIVRRKLMSENFFVNDTIIDKYKSSAASSRRIKFAVNASYNDSFSVNEWLQETKSIESDNLGIPLTLNVEQSVTLDKELEDLLILFHQYLRASFKPCPKATQTLAKLGFEFENIRVALRYTGNNTSESVEYLIGNTDPNNDGAKCGLDTGISRTSDMYNIIMSDPEIIIPLCSPNVLYACLSVMDANSFLISSIRFPSIMNLLNKILTSYYVNKCDMVMQQMLGHMPND